MLLEIYHRQDGLAFCRVKVGELVSTDVPIMATDRGIPLLPVESMLSYQSIQQLLLTYQGIMEVCNNETATNQSQEKQANCPQKRLVVLDRQTTTAICTDNRDHLSATSQSQDDTTGEP